MRLLREIQGHMRLRISGDRNEVRQSYLQTLFDRLVRRFEKDGSDAVGDMISLMDEYFLTRDDFDSIVELSIGKNDGEALMKNVPPMLKLPLPESMPSSAYADLGIIPRHIQWHFKRRAQWSQQKGARKNALMWRTHLKIVMKVKSSKRHRSKKMRRIPPRIN